MRVVAVRTRNCFSLRKRCTDHCATGIHAQRHSWKRGFDVLLHDKGKPLGLPSFSRKKSSTSPVMQAAIVRESLLDLHPRNGPGQCPVSYSNPVYASHLLYYLHGHTKWTPRMHTSSSFPSLSEIRLMSHRGQLLLSSCLSFSILIIHNRALCCFQLRPRRLLQIQLKNMF